MSVTTKRGDSLAWRFTVKVPAALISFVVSVINILTLCYVNPRWVLTYLSWINMTWHYREAAAKAGLSVADYKAKQAEAHRLMVEEDAKFDAECHTYLDLSLDDPGEYSYSLGYAGERGLYRNHPKLGDPA